MKKIINAKLRISGLILLIPLFMTACFGNVPGESQPPVSAQANTSATPAATTTATVVLQVVIPDDSPAITRENTEKISELADVSPAYPPYLQVSPDGRVGARADLSGIDVYEMDSKKLMMHIAAELPDCQYSTDRYFVFNQNGGFIALAAKDSLQVWQIGGGRIYSAPYSLRYRTDAATCGADIPQLALSPDGRLLAVNGMEYTQTSTLQYFRIIDVLDDRTVYEWDGKDDSLHGALYPYQGLGFSADGKLMQTFDPTRYYATSGEEYQSFRFWSVQDGQELDRNAAEILADFEPADLSYALQTDDAVAVKSRLTGQAAFNLTGTGCSQAAPCDLKFSGNGKYLALLDNDSVQAIAFHHDLLHEQVNLWDLAGQSMVKSQAIFARNLDGIRIGDDGAIQDAASTGSSVDTAGVWWTSTFNFNGLLASGADRVAFSPQRLSFGSDDCYFCGSCTLNLTNLQRDCRENMLVQGNSMIAFSSAKDTITLKPENGETIEVPLATQLQAGWDVRLLGYAPLNHTVFYCLDKNRRSQTCTIFSAESDKEIAAPEDIYGLRFSADGSSAAYINRNQKALFLVNLQKGKASRVPAYQSRASFINPVFLNETPHMVFLIQNLNDAKLLSLEWVDTEDGGVQRRVALEEGQVREPGVLAMNEKDDLLAVGSRDGWIYILDADSGKTIASWQASAESLIGLTFARSDGLILSLDRNGEIKAWGIK